MNCRIYDDFRSDFIKRVQEIFPASQDDETIAVVRTATKVDEAFLASRPRLKYVLRGGAGLDNVDVSACERRGVEVFSTPGANARAVGEFGAAALVALARGLQPTDNDVRNQRWIRIRGRQIGNTTVGIIGFGHTGRALAKALSGFDCKILAYDKYRKPELRYAAELDHIYHNADVVSFHVPLTEETHNYLNEDFIAQMRKPFCVLNLSRGEVVDLYALRDGLKSEKIWGAHLDVLPFEPQKGKELALNDEQQKLMDELKSYNVRFSAHIAGRTEESEANIENALLKILQDVRTKNT